MQVLQSTLARRLMIGLILLLLLPVLSFALILERSVGDAIEGIAGRAALEQARLLAVALEPGLDPDESARRLNVMSDEDQTAFVLDPEGLYRAHADPDRIGRSAWDDFTLEAVGALTEGREGVVREIPSGRRIAFAPIAGGRDVVVVVTAPDSGMGPLQTIRAAALGQAAFAAVAVLFLGIFVIARFIAPVQALTRAAEQIDEGELRLDVDRSAMQGELGVLASAIDRMAERLSASYTALEGQAADRAQSLRTLDAVADLVSRSPELDALLRSALRGIVDAVDAGAGAIFLLRDGEAGGEGLELAQLSEGATGLRQAASDPSWALRAIDGRRAVLRSEGAGETGHGAASAAAGGGIRSVVCVPLMAAGRPLGALTVVAEPAGHFRAEDVDLLVTIGNQMGVAVENARLYGRAAELATLEERQRLARDLHDALSQSLYAITLHAEAAKRLLRARRTEESAELVEQLAETAHEALKEMRLLVFELRPPVLQQAGLEGALRLRLEAVEKRSGVSAELDAEGLERLPQAVEGAFYRIAQEALNNALKHADAAMIRVLLRQEAERLTMRIEDDGRGFEEAKVGEGGFGLAGMRERAEAVGADLRIEGTPGRGTRVVVTKDLTDAATESR